LLWSLFSPPKIDPVGSESAYLEQYAIGIYGRPLTKKKASEPKVGKQGQAAQSAQQWLAGGFELAVISWIFHCVDSFYQC
tara:strand:- start:485 stop:724 length:240 start_codon:yes stop_codon:yes gene_type:complete